MLLEHYSVLKSTIVVWSLGFVLLWIALLNMGVFPRGLLPYAIPWSFAETYIAALIGQRILKKVRQVILI